MAFFFMAFSHATKKKMPCFITLTRKSASTLSRRKSIECNEHCDQEWHPDQQEPGVIHVNDFGEHQFASVSPFHDRTVQPPRGFRKQI